MKSKRYFSLLLVSLFMVISSLTSVQAYEPRSILEDVIIDAISEESNAITGKAKAGDVIIITLDNEKLGVVVVTDTEGYFTFEFSNKITTESIIKLAFPERGPNEIIQVLIRPVVIAKPEVNAVREGEKIITGTGEVGRKITLEFEDGTKREQIVSESGTWVFNFDEPLVRGTKLGFFLHNDKGHESELVEIYVAGNLIEIEKPEIKDPEIEIPTDEVEEPKEEEKEKPGDEVETPDDKNPPKEETEDPKDDISKPDDKDEEVSIDEVDNPKDEVDEEIIEIPKDEESEKSKVDEVKPIIEVEKEAKVPNTGINNYTLIFSSILVISVVYLVYSLRKRKQ